MKKKIALIIGSFMLAILLLMAWVAVYALRQPQGLGKVFSSPRTVRARGLQEWDRLMADSLPSPSVDASFFDSLKITATSESLTVTIGDPNQPPSPEPIIRGDQVNYTVYRSPPGGGFVDDQTSFRLRCLGVAAPHPPQEATEQPQRGVGYADYPVQYFNLDGRLLTEEEERQIFKERRIERSDYLQANEHSMTFYFDLNGFDSPKILGSWLFDRTTKESLSSGGRWHNPEQNPYDFGHRMSTWRSAPVDLIVDVAHGPLELRDVAPQVGELAVFDDFECRLIAIADGYSNSSSRSAYRIEIGIQQEPPKEGSNYLFSISPECHGRSLEVEALDHAGNPLSYASKNGSGNIIMVESNQPREKIGALRLIHRPFTKRIVVPVDQLPGLPEMNSEVDNLFDVRIPYVWLNNEHQMERLIRGALQLQFSKNFTAVVPEDFFPREYRDATPREILEDYWSLFPETDIEIDQDNGQLNIQKSKPFWDRVADKLGF